MLLVVIRQTNGWVDRKYGGRRKYARISHTLFMDMCGLSRRSVCGAIQSLVEKRYVEVMDRNGVVLSPRQRRGRWCLYYRCLLNFGEQRVKRKSGSGWMRELISR